VKRAVPVGTLIFEMPMLKDMSMTVSVLKDSGTYPPDPDRKEDWVRLPQAAGTGWTSVTAPPETQTRALRITFYRCRRRGRTVGGAGQHRRRAWERR
jgi:hypothetical protein